MVICENVGTPSPRTRSCISDFLRSQPSCGSPLKASTFFPSKWTIWVQDKKHCTSAFLSWSHTEASKTKNSFVMEFGSTQLHPNHQSTEFQIIHAKAQFSKRWSTDSSAHKHIGQALTKMTFFCLRHSCQFCSISAGTFWKWSWAERNDL